MTSPSAEVSPLHQVYNKAFYAEQVAGSVRSASAVVPRILAIFPHIASVVDVGCGTGTWLHQFQLNGVKQVRGLDGGEPTAAFLHIRKDEFLCRDLSKPFDLEEKFDLAMSLEVAEHLPPEFAASFVANLTRLSDLILFGAAIPGQGGTNHFNEQWPSYWAALFREQGYACFDVLRKQLWYDERIEWWYKQNTLIFAKESRGDLVAALVSRRDAGSEPLDLVHPRCFEIYRTSQGQALVTPAAPATKPASIDNTLQMTSELIELRARVHDIERSAGWRMILSVRRLVTPFPALRAVARGAARAALRVFSVVPTQRP
jgi:SAM-dependent methyltransferase